MRNTDVTCNQYYKISLLLRPITKRLEFLEKQSSESFFLMKMTNKELVLMLKVGYSSVVEKWTAKQEFALIWNPLSCKYTCLVTIQVKNKNFDQTKEAFFYYY